MQWCGYTPFQLTLLQEQQLANFFKSSKQIRIPPTLSLFAQQHFSSPLLPSPHSLSHHCHYCSTTGGRKAGLEVGGTGGGAPESLLLASVRLYAELGSSRDSGGRRWVPPPCPVPLIFSASPGAGTGKLTCPLLLLVLLCVFELGSTWSPAGTGPEQLWSFPPLPGSAGDSKDLMHITFSMSKVWY